MGEGVFYQVPSFPLLHANQGSDTTSMCYASLTVWTYVCGNSYAQQNMRGRGSNSRHPDSDIMFEDPLYQSNYKTQVI
jgi:hypothetical protein